MWYSKRVIKDEASTTSSEVQDCLSGSAVHLSPSKPEVAFLCVCYTAQVEILFQDRKAHTSAAILIQEKSLFLLFIYLFCAKQIWETC